MSSQYVFMPQFISDDDITAETVNSQARAVASKFTRGTGAPTAATAGMIYIQHATSPGSANKIWVKIDGEWYGA